MLERNNIVTMRGNPVTLLGQELKMGDKAPDFQLINTAIQPVSLNTFKDKVLVISSVPSLDTPVCDLETRRFNAEAANLGMDVNIITVSMDLPFAQKRWCGAAGVDRVVTLSDHREASFGLAYGVLIKKIRLLTRAVFVLDKNHVITDIQIVNETKNEPDYEKVLSAVKTIL